MLSELCVTVQSGAIVPFNVDVDDALGVYDASAGFGVSLREATANHTQTHVRLLIATPYQTFSSLEGKRRSPSRSFSVVLPGRVCTSNYPTSIL